MLYGEVPFRDTTKEKLNQQILSGDYQLPDTISKESWDLIKGILTVDYNEWFSIKQIINHPWMKHQIKISQIYTPMELEAIWKVYDMNSLESDPMN